MDGGLLVLFLGVGLSIPPLPPVYFSTDALGDNAERQAGKIMSMMMLIKR